MRHVYKKQPLIRQVLIGLVCGSLLLAGLMVPVVVAAEPIMAVIVTADLPRYHQAHEAMVKVLQTGGFGEGKLKVFKQTPNADKMSLVNSLRRAEAAGAELVVTYGSQATLVAKDELKNTPLLFADVYDPVELGAVKTLEAPGTDASGATSKTSMESLVKDLLSIKTIKSVGGLYTKGEKGSEQQLAELKALGKSSGFSVEMENARNPKEAVNLASQLCKNNEALFLSESVAVSQQSKEILAEVQSTGCMVFSQSPGLVEAGALIGLEADPGEQGKLVAVHALQVLQGQKVHLLPVRTAKKISLKINKNRAAEMGLTIPPAVAAKAKLM